MKICVAFLASLVIVSIIRPALGTRAVAGTKAIEFIKESCKETPYSNLCHTSLSSHASEIGTDPVALAHAALTVALESAQPTSTMIIKMAHGPGLHGQVAIALRSCVKEMSDSVHKIKRSMVEMKELKSAKLNSEKIRNVQEWLNDAVIYDDRCTYALTINSTAAEIPVREQTNNVAHLTIIALALINKLTSAQFAGRKNIDFIRDACKATSYPNICYASLSNYADEIERNPKLLVRKAIALTLTETKSTVSMMGKEARTPGLNPDQKDMVLSCEEESNSTVSEIETALRNFDEFSNRDKNNDMKYVIVFIQLELDAVYYKYEQCVQWLGGVSGGMNRKVMGVMTERIRKVEQLSPIALSLFESFIPRLHRT